nr:epsin-3 isoform X1 [Ipomoea batatas]
MSVPPPTKMAQPFIHEFKKQASFFLREKIKTARLALTDVTPAQLLAEEATSGGQGSPDTRTLKMISRAAFEIDDYWRITEIMHKRLERFDRRNWRVSYQALIVLEHLMTHGPESVAKEFQTAQDVIQQMGNFQFIDERGFNWGLNVRKKSERVLQLLENGKLLKEERDKARKITRGIEGFGSFSHRTHAAAEGVKEESTPEPYRKCNSLFIDDGKQEDDTKSESPTISWSGSDDSSMNGSSSSARHKKKEGTARSSKVCNCSSSLTRVGVNSGLSLLFRSQQFNPKSANLLATYKDHSPADESKMDSSFPHETALRTSLYSSAGVRPNQEGYFRASDYHVQSFQGWKSVETEVLQQFQQQCDICQVKLPDEDDEVFLEFGPG